MKTKITLFLFILVSMYSYSQKGIFKKGTIAPSVYNEKLEYRLVNDLIYLDVEINNNKYTFILDTGAPTTISTKVKGDFEFLLKESIVDASNNSQDVNYVSIPSIKIGNLEFTNFAAMQEDLSLLTEAGVDGLIGGNIICRSAWDFDLEKNNIVISNTLNKEVVKKGFKEMKVALEDTGTPTVSMKYFNKIGEENIYFDTGYNDFFYLSNDKFLEIKKANLVSTFIEGNGVISQSAFGDGVGNTFLMPLEMSIGGHKLPTFITDVDIDEESNLGAKWLTYYRTILYKNKLYFKANNTSMKKEVIAKSIKIDFKGTELYITFVWNTPFTKEHNLKIGDKILSINNKDISSMSPEDLKKVKSTTFKEKEVLIEVNTKGNFVLVKDEVLLSL